MDKSLVVPARILDDGFAHLWLLVVETLKLVKDVIN
jgi:hypothetical protein